LEFLSHIACFELYFVQDFMMLSYTNAGVATISEERKAKYLTYDPNVWIADLMGQVNGLLDAAEAGKHMAACLQMLAHIDPNCAQQAIAVVQEAKFRLILFSRAVIMSHVVRSVCDNKTWFPHPELVDWLQAEVSIEHDWATMKPLLATVAKGALLPSQAGPAEEMDESIE
jgi:hypothetical protein